MPRRRKNVRRSYARRRSTRRRTQRSRGMRITSRSMPTLFPDQVICKLQTVFYYFNGTSTSTGGITISLNGNDLSDPGGTGATDIRATGLDQYAAFYNRYYVAGCRATVKLYPFKTDNDIGMLHLMPTMFQHVEGNWVNINLNEQPYCKHKEQYLLAGRNGASTLSTFMSSHKISGGELAKTNPDATAECAPGVVLPPNILWHYTIRVENISTPTTNQLDFVLKVSMIQYVCFYKRYTLVDSVPIPP